MRVIIAGSRNYDNTEDFFRRMDSVPYYAPWLLDITEIVSGTARDTDTMGEVWADHFDIPVKRFPANWEKFGRSAGYRRNAEMAQYANGLVAFWDGLSPGTRSMIDLAKGRDLKVHIERI